MWDVRGGSATKQREILGTLPPDWMCEKKKASIKKKSNFYDWIQTPWIDFSPLICETAVIYVKKNNPRKYFSRCVCFVLTTAATAKSLPPHLRLLLVLQAQSECWLFFFLWLMAPLRARFESTRLNYTYILHDTSRCCSYVECSIFLLLFLFFRLSKQQQRSMCAWEPATWIQFIFFISLCFDTACTSVRYDVSFDRHRLHTSIHVRHAEMEQQDKKNGKMYERQRLRM